jgi:tRNA(fMet)-specific endonuclease VapC
VPYLLDSDVVIGHLNGWPAIVSLTDRLRIEGIAICTVTYMEVYEGILLDPDPLLANERFQAFLATVPILPFTVHDARRCARLRAELSRLGRRSRSRYLDLMIAATAIAHDLTLVTRNVADYRDVPGLALASPEHLEAFQT